MPNKDPEKRKAYNKTYGKVYRMTHRRGSLREISTHRAAHEKTYRTTHRREISARHNVYRAAHPEKVRAGNLRCKYGLSLEAFDALLAGQGGVCAICRTKEWKGKFKIPVIDHDHESGNIRGIVCSNCNVALGFINDNLKIAQAMVRYLKKFKSTGILCAAKALGLGDEFNSYEPPSESANLKS